MPKTEKIIFQTQFLWHYIPLVEVALESLNTEKWQKTEQIILNLLFCDETSLRLKEPNTHRPPALASRDQD